MPTSSYDLTTVAACKQWSSVTTAGDDALIQVLVTSMSRAIIRELGKSPFMQRYSEVRDGNGNNRISTINFPLINVHSVKVIGGVYGFGVVPFMFSGDIPFSNGTTAGYVFSDSDITLIGAIFPIGKSNVVLDYDAGFTDVVFENTTLSGTTYTVSNAGTFIKDMGVYYALTGTPLVQVTSNPSQGQYTYTQGTLVGFTVIGGGNYGFNAGDSSANIIVSYRFGYIPDDLVSLATEAVGLLYADRKRIGQVRAALGGQNTEFLQLPLPAYTQSKLNNLRTKVPIV